MNDSKKTKETVVKKDYPLLMEMIPLILFLASNKLYGIYVATYVLVIVGVLNFIAAYIYTKKINYMILITTVFLVIFGSLTIIFKDATFIKIKITIINFVLSILFFTNYFYPKFNFLKTMFRGKLNMPANDWKKLNHIWALFFLALGILNELVWRNVSTDMWVNFKVFGVTGLTFVFTILQMPWLMKYMEPNKKE